MLWQIHDPSAQVDCADGPGRGNVQQLASELLLIQLCNESALFNLAQEAAVDELLRLGIFGAGIALGHPGQLGLDGAS